MAVEDLTPARPTRRGVILGALGLVGTAALTACSGPGGAEPARTFGPPTPLTPTAGQRVTSARLVARPTTVDLGGPRVATWAYGGTVPGPLIRAKAGDLVRVSLVNDLPADTTIHWHGIALRNAADGVPGMTQDPVRPGATYSYEFVVPQPGTYFYHPHVGVQLDRGLYAPLVVDDPDEPGDYDVEHVVVLDDWLDGTGRTPDDVLADLRAAGGADSDNGMGGMGHMDGMGGIGGMAGTGGFGAGDVDYPYFLVNGRVPESPDVLRAEPGQRVRLRIINAASDTIFLLALGGHTLSVTHTDGYAVEPTSASALVIGQGERFDAVVTLADGVFPLVAVPAGRSGQGMALVRTGSGAAPSPAVRPAELDGRTLLGSDLRPATGTQLPVRSPDVTSPLALSGSMRPYVWTINGAPFGENEPIGVARGDRVRLQVGNMSMMSHPLHVHGHTFGLVGSGLRKDTVLVRPMERLAIDLEADNAGDWMVHCHNAYHGEAGMMIALEYRT